ncbi:MAG: VOC family protein [Pseudomonadota bacterium]|nr:VOC family protein [Pseudomonadota bacterium]
MHLSRLAGFIIDCRTADLDAAASFWGGALGLGILGDDGPKYVRLDAAAHALSIEVQQVEHESRVHLDIETDNVDAEVQRLESLGAARHLQGARWWVMQAPTGQRFCVVQTRVDLSTLAGVTRWP